MAAFFRCFEIEEMIVYITNLGKFKEKELVETWFTLSIDQEDSEEQIGLNNEHGGRDS